MELTHRPFLRSRGADRSLTGLVVLLLADIAFIIPLVQLGMINRHAHDLALVAVMGLGAIHWSISSAFVKASHTNESQALNSRVI